MPTYEYLCDNCDHRFEKFQSITAKPIRKCPECARLKLRRLIGCGAGVIFKGSGFYETDYRSDSYKKSAEAEKKQTTSAGDKKDKTTSDSAKKTPKSKTQSKPKPKTTV